MSDWESNDDEAELHGMFWGDPELSDGEQIDTSWYDEDTGAEKPGVRMPEQWRFLWKWFHVLRYKLKPSEPWRLDTHDVRIGRESDDWRIDVRFLEELRREGATLETTLKRIRKVREALMLTTMFAEVDYDTWLRELKFTSLYKPMVYMDLKTHRLQRKYAITYYGDFPAECASFTRDLAKLTELAAAEGVDVCALKSIPIELHSMCNQYCESTRRQQRQIVRNIHETARQIFAIEHERRNSQRLHGAAPVLNLGDGVILNFRSIEIRSRLLEEIRRVVDSGVRIKYLALPARWWHIGEDDTDEESDGGSSKSDSDEDSENDSGEGNNYSLYYGDDADADDLIYDAIDYWVPLARSLTGNSHHQTHVTSLLLPTWYCCEPLLTAFCSALATAKELKFVRLEAYMEEDGFTKRVSWRTWAWLGYALFNKASTSSVEVLSLAEFEVNEDYLNSLEDATRAKDPLAHLWREGFVCNGPSSRPQVMIKTKAKLDLYDSNSTSDEYIEAPELVYATAMDDGPIVDVMFPGLGFCRVDRASIGSKRQKRSPASASTPKKGTQLKTLLLDFRTQYHEDDPLDADIHLPRLLEIVGESLTSLSIIATDLELFEGLEHCRRLENLSLGGVTLESMDAVMELYNLDVKISSLERHDIKVPIEKFDYFLREIEDNKFLQRLRIGERFSHHFCTTTAQAGQTVLESNTLLQFVHLYYTDFGNEARDPLRKWDCQNFHKQAA